MFQLFYNMADCRRGYIVEICSFLKAAVLHNCKEHTVGKDVHFIASL